MGRNGSSVVTGRYWTSGNIAFVWPSRCGWLHSSSSLTSSQAPETNESVVVVVNICLRKLIVKVGAR
jgi:hypothetical protein